PHDVFAREQEPTQEDAPDASLSALFDLVANVDGRWLSARRRPDDDSVAAAGRIESLDRVLPVLRVPLLPRSAGLEWQRRLDLARRHGLCALDRHRADDESRTLGDRNHDPGSTPVVEELGL